MNDLSCLTNLLTLFSEVYEAVDQDNAYVIIYLDFSKAFNKVTHERLIRKIEAHGIGDYFKIGKSMVNQQEMES